MISVASTRRPHEAPGPARPDGTPVPAMYVVPHTHWDREWYEPHDVFRARLVMVMDRVLDLLDADPEFAFTLDGQAAAFGDYLEIRPEMTGRLRAAVARGQLDVGPLCILLDEFGCDGESIIRNLEMGIRESRGVGGEMRVGYLPDMFGHAAQLPQILRGFGLEDAALWRGVPARVDRDAFLWRAPDGSEVRVEYLWDGYGSALALFEPLPRLAELVGDYLDAHADRFGGHPPAGMYGTDHMAPRADLARVVREHNRAHPGQQLRIATLGQVIASRDYSPDALAALPVVLGEMRSHARGNILPGVISVRTAIKAAMARAERALTTAERLDAWAGGPSRTALMERGWRLVVESSAHDSVTGCGSDDTADEVESRLRVAEHTARGAVDTALGALAATAPRGTLAVFNQSGWWRPVQAEMVVERTPSQLPEGVQLLEELPTVLSDEAMPADRLPLLLRRIHGREYLGRQIRGYRFDGPRELTFEVGDDSDVPFDLAQFAQDLERHRLSDPADDPYAGVGPGVGPGAGPGADQRPGPGTIAATITNAAAAPWRVRSIAPPSSRVLVGTGAPGMARAVADPAAPCPPTWPVRVTGSRMSNGLVDVTVDAAGLVAIEDLTTGRRIGGALGLVDEGDRGDSYNFAPVGSPPIDQPVSVQVTVCERGPLRGRIVIGRTYLLPVGLVPGDRSRRSADVRGQLVEMLVELRADEPFLRVRVTQTNGVADHRMRVLVPALCRDLPGSAAAGQYGITLRRRTAEGGGGEYPIPTFPGSRFVAAGGVAVLTDRLMEYELLTPPDGPDVLALTVLRAVGMMSVNDNPMRDEPAGSEVPVPGAQYLGRCLSTDFTVDLSGLDWSDPRLIRHADAFRFEPVSVRGTAPAGATPARAVPARAVSMGAGLAAPAPAGAAPTVEAPAATHPAPTSPASTHPAPPSQASTHSASTSPASTHSASTSPASTHSASTSPASTHSASTSPAPTSPASTHGGVALESLRRLRDGALEARFVNYSDRTLPLDADLDGEWHRTDMTGAVLDGDGRLRTDDVAPFTILTLRRPPRGQVPPVPAAAGADPDQEEPWS